MSGGVVVLTGGVGGAKLVRGLQQIMPPERITAIVNTGDDFRHLGLHISPDVDTLLYTLSGKANKAQGWGREEESWSFMAALRELDGEDWFALGDHDLALHVMRSARLANGETLSAITADFAHAWGIGVKIVPMSEQAVATHVRTAEGWLEFQHYFVRQRCEPAVHEIAFHGAIEASPAPGVVEAIAQAEAILVAPSNPLLSIDPLLAVSGIRTALAKASAPIVAVSPLIGGQAIKGPTAKLMREMGREVSNRAIASHYHGLIDGLVIDVGDEAPDGIAVARTDTMMRTDQDKARVATMALKLARELSRG